MKCQQALEMIGELVDNDLLRPHRLRLHLLICCYCRRYLASYRATIEAEKSAFRPLAGSDADEDIPDEQVAEILKTVSGG